MLQPQNHAANQHESSNSINEIENMCPTDDDNEIVEINTETSTATTYCVVPSSTKKSNQYAMCSQMALLASLTIANFSMGSIVSIQAHYYPAEEWLSYFLSY